MTKFERFAAFLTRRRYLSLNLKLALVIIIAAVLMVGTFLAGTALGNVIADRMYLSESARTRIVDDKYEELLEYIEDLRVNGTDTKLLQKWVDEEDYTQLIVYDKTHDYFNAGWTAEGDEGTQAIVENREEISEESAESDAAAVNVFEFHSDLYNRIVRFADKKYYVYLNVFPENHWYEFMNIFNILLAALVFVATILVYNRFVLRRIIKISEEVKVVSDGDLQHRIVSPHHDEIARLCTSVDAMRSSILEKMDAEAAARDANAQLITAMSHDIRTPLTSLIGYLDIIESGKYTSEEELNKYIDSCRDKAFQLKDLSDKLFSYFLVYSGKEAERELERVDAGILFQQLLMEHVAECTGYGFHFDVNYAIPEGVMIDADISTIRRLFDNLFSNIMKYADPAHTILVSGNAAGSSVNFLFENHVGQLTQRVESSRIGVKTCRKICEDMHGTFHAIEENDLYITEIRLPIALDK